MCTLIVAVQRWPGVPLVVAANRDERFDRPAGPPRLWPTDPEDPLRPELLAPEDLQAGGTWIGLNRRGVFAAITNRWPTTIEADRRSRGLLVLQALAAGTAEGGAGAVAACEATDYNAFHLLIADRLGAHLVWSDGAVMTARPLEPGLHVLTEQSLQGRPVPREQLVRDSGLFDGPEPPRLPELTTLLATRRTDAFAGLCVRYEPMNYGTRSSSVLIERDGAPPELHYADGPPGEAPWDSVRLPWD